MTQYDLDRYLIDKYGTYDNLYSTHHYETIEVKNNRMIIFPGIIPHGVTPIKIKKEGKSMGRFTITNFLSTRI